MASGEYEKKHSKLKPLLETASRRGMSRREFLESAFALGLTGSTAASLWGQYANASPPKKGGHFRVAVDDGSVSESLEPGTYTSTFMHILSHTMGNYLVEITEENVIGPELAESWEVSVDAATWIFKLRRGVEFHNGKSFDAHDVVASLNFHRAENSKSASKVLLKNIEDIQADGKHTVVIKLAAGNADLPYVFSEYNLVMLPADNDGNISWANGVGTGGYVLKHFEPGVSAKLERFPNYFKQDRAHFEEVDLLLVSDVNARQNAVITGQVDAMIGCDLNTVHFLEENQDIRVDSVQSGFHGTLPMHTNSGPFSNNDLRLALKYGIDRSAILDTILKGYGALGNDHPIGPTLPYFASELEQRVFDPEKAKHHLKKAGYDGLKLELAASDAAFAGAVNLALLYKETLALVGIDLEVQREPADGYWSNVWMVKPFSVASWGQRPTPDMIFSLGYSRDAEWNDTYFEHDKFNKLLLAARSELDQGKRTDLYFEMQQIIRDEGGTIVPFFQNHVSARRANVQHSGNLTGDWPLDGGRGCERWWFV